MTEVMDSMINDICAKNNLKATKYSDGFLVVIEDTSGKSTCIVGTCIGNNSANIGNLFRDKAATSDLLRHFDIDHVDHRLVIDSSVYKHEPIWAQLTAMLELHKKLVLKINTGGSQGKNVYLVTNQYELETYTNKLFKVSPTISVSPFYKIIDEYRCIVLDGKIEICFKKIRNTVIGDGERTVEELARANELEIDNNEIDCSYIPFDGEEIVVEWKHNLNNGAEAEEVFDIPDAVSRLALKASDKLNIKFASIDVVTINDGAAILEINGNVNTSKFVSDNKDRYERVCNIYEKAILQMLK